MKTSLLTSLFSLLIGLTCMACGGGLDSNGMPKWVSDTPELCGVGIAKFRSNIGAARASAAAKARTDLGAQIETKVKSMVQSYNAEGGTADGDISEEMTKMASVNLSKVYINGSMAKKSMFDKENSRYYTLVCLNPDVLTDAIGKMNELNATQRKALEKRAKKAHEALEEAMKSYDD